MDDCPTGCRVLEVKEETPTVKTIIFEREFAFSPGQFVMVWIPGVDEVPMSLSGANRITVKDVGKATHALCSMKTGDWIGLRGPYGNGFPLKGKSILAVGGGFGLAPLRPLFWDKKIKNFVIGAKSKAELLFLDECKNKLVCTDDGSSGEKAFVTQLADKELAKKEYDLVVACGPEIMLKYLFQVCEKHKVPVEFNMERWFKCGFGLCGHCAVDATGWRVCKEGPVATTEVLRKNKEFFSYKRDKSGAVVPL